MFATTNNSNVEFAAEVYACLENIAAYTGNSMHELFLAYNTVSSCFKANDEKASAKTMYVMNNCCERNQAHIAAMELAGCADKSYALEFIRAYKG